MYAFRNISGLDQKIKTFGYGPVWAAGEARIVRIEDVERFQRLDTMFEQLEIVSRSAADDELLSDSGTVTVGGGGHFFDIRPLGYVGDAAPGSSLVLLDGSAQASVTLKAGLNFLMLSTGGACTLTLVPPTSRVVAPYEVIDADGSSSASVFWVNF